MASLVLLLAILTRDGLTGTIQSIDQKPVATAVVTVVQDGRTTTAPVDAHGVFSLPAIKLPATIEVKADGFTTVRQLVDASPLTITLTPSPIHESIVVSEPARDDEWRRPATGTTVISAETMAALPGVTADETLRTIAGLTLFRRSTSRASNPTTHGVTMRGLSASGSSRGLVMLDGIPFNDGFGGWVTWTRLPALATSSIAIDRGAEGATFGSDALGGVVDIATWSGDRRNAQAAVTFGTEALGTFDGSIGGRTKAVTWFGAVSTYTTDGVIPVAPESRGHVDVPADATWFNGLIKIAGAGSFGRLTFTALGGSDDRGNGTVLQRNRMEGGTGSLAYDATFGATNVAARVAVSPNNFRQSFSSVAAGRATETLTSTQFTDTWTTRAIVEAGRPIPKGYLTGRASLSRATAEFTEVKPAITTAQSLDDNGESVAAHAAWNPAAWVSIGAGIRHEWRTSPHSDSDTDEATVGSVSGAWQLSHAFALRGSVGTSHRWPTLNEQVRNFQVGSVLTLANPNLEPEHGRMGDAALTFTTTHWNASAGGFWTNLENAIANVTIQSTPTIIRERRNAGRAVAKGFELDAEARPWSMARVRVSALFVDSRFRDSLEPALEGNYLPQVPRTSVAVSGDVRVRAWLQGAAFYRWLAPQFDDDRNQFELASASQVDVRLFGDLYKHFTWQVTVENAADSRIEVGKTPLVTLAPGRAVRAGVTWKR